MINLLRVMLFICGFIIGAHNNTKTLAQSQQQHQQQPEITRKQQFEQVSRDTLTWEDRNY